MKLDLTPEERTRLRRAGIKKADVAGYAATELVDRLGLSPVRAAELRALAVFQSIKSLGYEFARDLLFLGYYELEELRDTPGAELLDAFERKKDYRTDPCVEDQFRRVVHFARTGDNSLSWFDFTAERKAYRARHGYPDDRPTRFWADVLLKNDSTEQGESVA